jgi:3-hydroxyacyl-[acyl-carrier-protein] dehydratase
VIPTADGAHVGRFTFDARQIQRLLPHKYPFLLLDGAYDIEPGLSGCGKKLYTINEWFFVGHFPGDPIVPGVLLLESLAQLTAVVYLSRAIEQGRSGRAPDATEDLSVFAGQAGYLAKANVKFLAPARPGDEAELNVRITRRISNLSLAAVRARVGGNVVVEGEISVSQKGGLNDSTYHIDGGG